LDPFPEVIFNDAKFRDFLRRPLVLGIRASDALSCFRIFLAKKVAAARRKS
jgi:hypothetical protein